MLRLSHRFTPPWFHFFKKSTGRGSGCQRLRYIRRCKALPPGGGFRLPRPPSATGFSFFQLHHEKSKKKKKVGLSTLFPFLVRQGFARCRVIWPCDILPCAAVIPAWPGPLLTRRSGSARRHAPCAAVHPCPLREFGRAQVCSAPRTFRAHESEAIPSACCAAQISLQKIAEKGLTQPFGCASLCSQTQPNGCDSPDPRPQPFGCTRK